MGFFSKTALRDEDNNLRAQPYSAPRSLTAAAERVNISENTEITALKNRRQSDRWQDQAIEYLDLVGELKFSANLVSSVLSRIMLFPGYITAESLVPSYLQNIQDVPEELKQDARSALRLLGTGNGGVSGLLRDAALNLFVAGEALDVNTMIPTPAGLVRMGDLKDGDFVFGGDGSPVRVIKVLPILENRPTYRITFDSGASIVADENHLWEVYPVARRRWSKTSGKPLTPSVLSTKDMLESVSHFNTSNYAIKRSITKQTYTDMLPIDPYILGYWLGDGWSSQGAITAHPDDQSSLQTELATAGYESKVRNAGDGYQVGVYGLKTQLRGADVLSNKHVPEEYFLASTDARLALVQGLVDSDGHVYRNGQIEFSNKNPEILRAFIRLTASLGLKPGPIKTRSDGTSRINVRAAGLPLARLPRKAAKLGTQTERDRWDYIKSIEPTESVPVRCIAVDSDDHTFLASEHYIRTHNCYLVQQPAQGNSPEKWQIRSVKELEIETGRNGGVFIKGRRNLAKGDRYPLPKNSYIGRIWNSHPAYSDEADSSVRGLLELLDELLLLNRAARAIARSKLNAGIVGVPDSLDAVYQADGEFADPEDPDNTVRFKEDETESFIETLQETLSRPVQDESAPSSLVPTMFRGTKEDIDAIRHITFERPFDEVMMQRADKVMERILAGLDIPKEVVSGISDSKYSNAVVIEETLYKSHIEPLALLLVDSLTEVFLHPVLRAKGWTDDDLENIVLWYDPSAITTKPSKAQSATEGYNMHLLSGDAWRRAHGFSASDSATELETGQRLAVERGLLSESVTEALLATLMPELMASVRQHEIAQSSDGADLIDALDGDTIPDVGEEGPEAAGTVGDEPTGETGSPSGLIEP